MLPYDEFRHVHGLLFYKSYKSGGFGAINNINVILSLSSIAKIVFAILIFRWKKAGLFGYIGTVAILLILDFISEGIYSPLGFANWVVIILSLFLIVFLYAI